MANECTEGTRSRAGTTDTATEVYTARARRLRAEATAALARGLARAVRDRLAELWSAYQAYRERRRTYAELTALDDAALRDIGISRSDIPAIARGTWRPARGEASARPAGAAQADGAPERRPQNRPTSHVVPAWTRRPAA